MDRLKPRVSVWLELGGRRVFGRREAELLEGVRKLGSLLAAAKALGQSYAHAWERVERLERELGVRVLEARRGGEGGGGAKLTEEGLRLLTKYLKLEEKAEKLLASGAEKLEVEAGPKLPELVIAGSDCMGVRLLAEMLSQEGVECEVYAVGSSGGLASLMLGEADIAGVHLLDEDTGEYNIPFIRRFWLEDRVVVLRGYLREQGLMVRRDNPKGITGLHSLLNPRVRFVNRNLGSGTRVLFDTLLRKVALEMGVGFKELTSRIRGYEVELRSHREVARMVSGGKADAGFGCRGEAEAHGLNFIPLACERFDFAVDRRKLGKPCVKRFMELLSSDGFWSEVERRGLGLRRVMETGRVIKTG